MSLTLQASTNKFKAAVILSSASSVKTINIFYHGIPIKQSSNGKKTLHVARLQTFHMAPGFAQSYTAFLIVCMSFTKSNWVGQALTELPIPTDVTKKQ